MKQNKASKQLVNKKLHLHKKLAAQNIPVTREATPGSKSLLTGATPSPNTTVRCCTATGCVCTDTDLVDVCCYPC